MLRRFLPSLCCAGGAATHKARFDGDVAQREWSEYQSRMAADEASLQQIMAEKAEANSSFSSWVAMSICPLLGLLLACVFLWTSVNFPPLPLQLEDIAWDLRWLGVSALDYYTCLLCFAGIAFASESCLHGSFWVFLILVLGAPFTCVYLVVRVCQHGNLTLLTMRDPRFLAPREADAGLVTGYASGFYVVAGLSLAVRILWNSKHYPFLTPQEDDPEWLAEWLVTTTSARFTAALCICGIVFCTEGAARREFWSMIILVFGGSGACAYLAYRAWRHQSITLQHSLTEW